MNSQPSATVGRVNLPRPNFLALSALLVVLLAAIPLLFVIHSSGQLGSEQWTRLWSARVVSLLFNTLSLAVLVAAGCFVLGVSCAWFVTRRDFPGRTLAVWLLVLPLTIPTYVFAHIYTELLKHDGWLGAVWHAIFGADTLTPDLSNVWGCAFILALAGFSYVFLLVRGALQQSTLAMDEAARIHGAMPWQVFLRVNLPMLRPAIAAGLAVVTLHVLSDFGAVSMLRYQTFTLSIYSQMSSRFDYQGAAGLSLILVSLSLSFLLIERFFRQRQRYYATGYRRERTLKVARGWERWVIWSWLGLVTVLAFVLPVSWMIVWSWEAWRLGDIGGEFWGYAFNSGLVSFIAATLAVILALPVGLYHTKRQNVLSHSFVQLSNVGFVLPGPVVALGIIVFVLSSFMQDSMPWLYGSFAALVMAVVIRFLPLAVQSQEAAMQQLKPSIEQAGRVLGAGPLENLWRVTIPMIRGGMISAWVLVFIDVLKELPATLILRPIGFDTLPVRIWIEASEEMLKLAAPAALVLVVGTLPAIWVMMRGEKS